MVFVNRVDAGRRLAARLRAYRGPNTVVLGLPRGGVPVAFEVARALGAPLDVIVVRKLGLPFQPELAMGAVGEDGAMVLNPDVLRQAGVGEADIEAVARREAAEVARRAALFRGTRRRVPLAGRTAIVVDDGIATGATARAACQVARAQGAARVVLAVPVCPPDAAGRLGAGVDELICLETPKWFYAVGQAYRDFSPTSDRQVVDLLGRVPAPAELAPAVMPSGSTDTGAQVDPPVRDEEVTVAAGAVWLRGRLTVPERARGVVIFAHGSGSSRHSPRNRYVAAVLQEAGLATLLFDLLTPAEETNRGNVFDVRLLADRLVEVARWVRDQPECQHLPVGYFGASTGAAAALWAAAAPGEQVAAVVSRGGRPDLAGERLAEVSAPTLLIVGGWDEQVLRLNQLARERLRCESRIAVVPGASHLFEEPGTLAQAANLAGDWFLAHMSTARQPQS